MSKKRSLVANFANLTAPATGGAAENAAKNPTKDGAQPRPVARAAAGVIGATQKTLAELRAERDRLQAELANKSEGLVSLDPKLIDPSPFRDRLADDDDEALEQLKTTITKDGQKSPITVRPHPSDEGRYQVVFGHRRLRATRELGIKVLSQIVDYSDHNLIVAQGIENAARQDLSWIERALFASEMRQAGVKAKDIKDALGVDDAQMSKFRTVTNAVPHHLLEKIGRAPAIGRPRWLELVKLIQLPDGPDRVAETLSDDKVMAEPSDKRFQAVVKALQSGGTGLRKSEEGREEPRFGAKGRVRFYRKGVSIEVPDKDRDDFHAFMEAEIGGIEKRFTAYKQAKDT